jgi:pimeloyl-ACP methyl ester carboxylesterase
MWPLASLLSMALLSQRVVAEVPPRTVAPAQRFNVGILSVERFGKPGAVPLIFIPALYCGAWQWNGQVSLLASRYDLYVVTLPGMDGRPRIEPDHLMERAVASLARLIAERAMVKPIVVGHSLGATIAVMFGEMHSGQAGGIIAAEGGHPVAPTAAAREAYVARAAAPFETADVASFDRTMRSTLRFLITSSRDVDTVAPLAERSDPHAIADWLRAALLLDLTPALHSIRAPFVEIVPYDASVDGYRGLPTLDAKRRVYATWVAHAPGGWAVVMIDRSRHFVMFDQPALFDRILSSEIDRMAGIR